MALLFKISRTFGAGLNLGIRLNVFHAAKKTNVSRYFAGNKSGSIPNSCRQNFSTEEKLKKLEDLNKSAETKDLKTSVNSKPAETDSATIKPVETKDVNTSSTPIKPAEAKDVKTSTTTTKSTKAKEVEAPSTIKPAEAKDAKSSTTIKPAEAKDVETPSTITKPAKAKDVITSATTKPAEIKDAKTSPSTIKPAEAKGATVSTTIKPAEAKDVQTSSTSIKAPKKDKSDVATESVLKASSEKVSQEVEKMLKLEKTNGKLSRKELSTATEKDDKDVLTAKKEDKEMLISRKEDKEMLIGKKSDKDVLVKDGMKLEAKQIVPGSKEKKSENLNNGEVESRGRQTREASLLNDLKYLDNQVKRIGRIDRNQIHRLLHKCKVGMTSVEAVMMLRCTGGLLVRESSADRQALSEQVWQVVHKCCPEVTVEMKNALLSVKLDNKMTFEPAEVLKEFEELNITPNKETFHLLLKQYCELGQTDKAVDLLNYMKSQDWSISIATIHALIRGYMKNGNVSGAKDIIKGMFQHGLRPTADTYTTMLVCHAEKNDIDSIKEVMRELTNKNLKIPLRNAYEVVIGLVQGGHASSISQVLEIVNPSEQLREQQFQRRQQMHVNRFATRQRTFDYHDTMNCVLELLSMNCCEGAVDLLKYAINNVLLSDSEEKLALGLRSVVMELLRKGVPTIELMSVRQRLIDNNLLTRDLEPIAHAALKLQKTGYLLDLFNTLKEEGFEFKCHYFWPALFKAANQKDVDGVYRLTDFLLKTVHTEPGSIQKTVFNWSLMPLVEKCAQDYPDVLERYKEIDVPKSMREMFEVACLLQRGALTEARNLIENGYKYAGHLVQNSLGEGWINSGFKSRELVDLLKTLNLRSVAPMKTNSVMLLKLLKTNHNNLTAEHFNDLIACWVDADLKLLPRYAHPLKVEAGKRGVTVENVKRLADQITSSQFSIGFDSPITKDLNSKDYLQPLTAATLSTKTTTAKTRHEKSSSKSATKIAATSAATAATVTAAKSVDATKTAKSKQQLKDQPQEGNVDVRREAERAPITVIRKLVSSRDYKGFKNTIHGLSEKPDLPVLLSVERMNLPMRVKSFFQRKLFSAYVNENKGKEMIDRLKDTPTMMANYLSVDVLRKLSEKDAKLFEHVESIFMSHPPMMTRTPTQATSKEANNATTTTTASTTSTTAATDSLASDDVKKGTATPKMNGRLYITPYLAFYTHYVKSNQLDKAKMLLEKFPQMKNMLRLGLLCKSLKMEKNEEMLVKLLDLHEDKENPKRVIPIFNNLLLSKCESNDHKSALMVYNDALSRGIVFDDFSVRSLQALQSVLQGHNQPMPWKEGELEKKAELASRKDFSDSDSD